MFRDALVRADARGAKDTDLCLTVVGSKFPQNLGIRPRVVDHTRAGHKVYAINVKQARKALEACGG